MPETCGCASDEFAALATKTDDELDAVGPDPRGDQVTVWGPNLIAPYGVPTGDGRRFRSGALSNRDLPLPVKWQRVDDQGHKSSVTVATMDGIRYDEDGPEGPGVYAWGLMLDPDPNVLPRLAEDVAEASLLLEKLAIGPSVDLDDMEYHPIDSPAELAAADGRQEIEVTHGRISAVTLVAIPAFSQARPFALRKTSPEEYEEMTAVTASGVRDDLAALPVADGEWDPIAWLLGRDFEGALYDFAGRSLFPVAQRSGGELRLYPAAVADAVSVMAYQGDQVALGEGAKMAIREQLVALTATCGLPSPPWVIESALTAAARLPGPLPAALFDDPKFTGPTPLRLEQVGDHVRVTGHLADWKTCHTGFQGTCIRAPRSRSNYKYFNVTPIPTEQGDVFTGKITLGSGHADTKLGFTAAMAHYDNTATAVADVRVGEDKHGIWISGAVRGYVDEKSMTELARAPLSGDWRPIGGSRELIAALAVNVPGFPVVQAHVANGREGALVAAGALHPEPDADERVKADLTGKKGKKRKRPMLMDDDEDDGMYAAEDDEELYFADLSADTRKAAAKKGDALPDGSYPIRNVGDLENAIQAYGRAKDKAATRRLIMRRARELKRPDLIPEGWLREREQMGVASLAREVHAFGVAGTLEQDLRRLDAQRLAERF